MSFTFCKKIQYQIISMDEDTFRTLFPSTYDTRSTACEASFDSSGDRDAFEKKIETEVLRHDVSNAFHYLKKEDQNIVQRRRSITVSVFEYLAEMDKEKLDEIMETILNVTLDTPKKIVENEYCFSETVEKKIVSLNSYQQEMLVLSGIDISMCDKTMSEQKVRAITTKVNELCLRCEAQKVWKSIPEGQKKNDMISIIESKFGVRMLNDDWCFSLDLRPDLIENILYFMKKENAQTPSSYEERVVEFLHHYHDKSISTLQRSMVSTIVRSDHYKGGVKHIAEELTRCILSNRDELLDQCEKVILGFEKKTGHPGVDFVMSLPEDMSNKHKKAILGIMDASFAPVKHFTSIVAGRWDELSERQREMVKNYILLIKEE